jgi:hypothetical protein
LIIKISQNCDIYDVNQLKNEMRILSKDHARFKLKGIIVTNEHPYKNGKEEKNTISLKKIFLK